jgi:glycosyltransferase involved in cell wall biosynthesis
LIKKKPTKIWLAYPKALSYSGQTAATMLIKDNVDDEIWDLKLIGFEPLDRSKNTLIAISVFVFELFRAWLNIFLLIFQREPIVYFNHGQSMPSFIRMGLPHLILKKIKPSARTITSLHGNVFMGWNDSSKELKLFKRILYASDVITVLGDNQLNKIVALGLGKEKVRVVRNTIALDIIDEKDLPLHDKLPIKILHLSLLIESKGYPEYLEALEILSKNGGIDTPLEAIICGPLSFTSYCRRFTTPEKKDKWIDEKVDRINSGELVKIQRINGAFGEEKQQLFSEADIFVFPSKFPVEAQPLVLLEAMSSGCAVITSSVGEIPSTVDSSCAIVLSEPDKVKIADSIKTLVNDSEMRLKMQRESIKRAKEHFSIERYVKDWEAIFSLLSKKN